MKHVAATANRSSGPNRSNTVCGRAPPDPGCVSAPPGNNCNRRKWIRGTAGCNCEVGFKKKKKEKRERDERLVLLSSPGKDAADV